MINVPISVSSPLVACQSDTSTIRKSSGVTDLWQQMREQTTLQHVRSASLSGLSHVGSGGGASDISPSSSHFFEVLYIGKIKVSNKKVPDTFIDDTLEKFRAHDLEKTRHRREAQLQAAAPATSREDLRRGSQDSTASESGSWDSISLAHTIHAANTDHSDDSKSGTESSHPEYHNLKSKRMSIDTNVHSMYAPVNVEQQHGTDQSEPGVETARRGSVDIAQTVNKEDEGKVAAPKSGKPGGESHQHNRTMVLQVGRTDLRLISPDRKQVLLHKQHCNVVRCVQGQRSPEHFGIVCKEPGGGETAAFVGYILRCESSAVTADAVAAISQASNWIEHKSGPFRTSVTSCEHCPMLWYHKLCADVEPLSDRKTQAVIFRRIDQLDEPEQTSILTKFRGAETHSIRDQNEFLMMLLRAHCEQKQSRHVHDTAETRSEFLSQYLGGGGPSGAQGSLFMKARRSLSNSFDHLLKRKGSKDDFGAMGLLGGGRDLTLPLGQAQGSGSEGRPRSHTIGSQSELKDMSGESTPTGENPDEDIKSPMMDIFMKVGSTPRTPPSDSTDSGQPETPTSLHSSWRQAIFNRVVTPNKSRTSSSSSADNQGAETSPGGAGEISPSKRNSAELRTLWRQAIKQAILLVRMEKENNKLRVRQEETAIKRLKLEYEDLASPAGAPPDFSSEHLELQRPSQALLRATALHGIPRSRRGDIWRLLQGPRHENHVHINLNQFIHYYTPYEILLKQLTSHQHAILIDLGRTFPTHKYFSTPLGPGQLALFNLLKAYSLLDPEVGYCQGLSFVAGVLLLHLDEPDAFSALKHLMFVRGLRDQYLPDMGALQVKLYQLSRLVHDRLPDLYRHFDQHEVCTTLYAAPWMLTLFASQFPLGFVARVFDLVFLDSPSAIFRVALALLEYNKEKLLACESFEEIMECLKGGVACLDTPEKVEGVMGAVYKIGDDHSTDDDMEHKLHEYRGEYQVLQEESATTRGKCAELKELRARVARLEEENRGVRTQLDIAGANVQRLERIRAMQQATINRLEMQCRGLEVSVITLGTYLDDLIDRRKLDIQVPGDVRRIVSQLMLSERRKTNATPTTNNATTDSLGTPSTLTKTLSSGAQLFRRASPGPGGRVMVKSLSTGLLSVNNAPAPSPDSTARATSLESQAELGKILRSSQLAKNVMSLPEKGIGLRVINTENEPDSNKPATGGSNTITKPSKDSSPQQHIGSNNRVFIKSLSNPNLGTKVSNFFSNSHNQILQQHRGDLGPMLRSTSMSNSIKQIIREDSRENLQQYERSMSSETDTSRTSTDTESSSNKDGTTSRVSSPFIKSRSNSLTPTRDFNSDKSNQTNSSSQSITDQTLREQSKTPVPTELCPKECINNNNNNNSTSSAQVSPTESIDSGVGVTPQSPDIPAHPLSGCDVNFTYNGTTKLKTIRSLRNLSRNSSPDLLGK